MKGGTQQQQNFIRGGSAPWSNPFPSVYIPAPSYFWQRRYPFRIPSTDKWIPFHIPSLDHCLPITSGKCTVFKYVINQKNQHTIFRLFHSCIKCIWWLFWAFLLTAKTQISLLYPFIIEVKSLPFHIPEAWQRYPFRAASPRLGHYGKYWGEGWGQQLITNMYWRTRGWWCIYVFQIISINVKWIKWPLLHVLLNLVKCFRS